MEPEGSIPSSQELSTCAYSEPDQSSPPRTILSLQDPSQCYPPNYASFFLLALLPIHVPFLPHLRYMSRPPQPPRLYNSVYTWRRVQIMQLLVMQFSPSSYHFIRLWSKQTPSLYSSMSETKFRAHTEP
jgi:hypothetical protein